MNKEHLNINKIMGEDTETIPYNFTPMSFGEAVPLTELEDNTSPEIKVDLPLEDPITKEKIILVHLDENNQILGFYNNIDYENLPDNTFPISAELRDKSCLYPEFNHYDPESKTLSKHDFSSLEEIKENLKKIINIRTTDEIVNNFQSSCLGSLNYYKHSEKDQNNINMFKTAGISPELKTSVDKKEWFMTAHTTKQLNVLVIDSANHISKCTSKAFEIKNKIDNCESIEELNLLGIKPGEESSISIFDL